MKKLIVIVWKVLCYAAAFAGAIFLANWLSQYEHSSGTALVIAFGGPVPTAILFGIGYGLFCVFRRLARLLHISKRNSL